MNFFIPFLMLSVPGIIAVSVHNRQLVHITRKNWQEMIWKYLIYSFTIVFVINVVMFFSYPQRTISYSPWVTWTSSHVLMSGFVVKYSLFAVAVAIGLPKLWKYRDNILTMIKKHKAFKISDDE